MDKGLIVSIQTYSQQTTQELALEAIESGAVAIRTDQPIKATVPVIGLKKDRDWKYYITPTREYITEVSKWANYVAIDCRHNNPNIELLLAHCHISGIKYIADIECVEDLHKLLYLCESKKIIYPAYITTALHVLNEDKLIDLISKIASYGVRNIPCPIIWEGEIDKLSNIKEIGRSLGFAIDYICIGNAISNIGYNTKKYKERYF